MVHQWRVWLTNYHLSDLIPSSVNPNKGTNEVRCTRVVAKSWHCARLSCFAESQVANSVVDFKDRFFWRRAEHCRKIEDLHDKLACLERQLEKASSPSSSPSADVTDAQQVTCLSVGRSSIFNRSCALRSTLTHRCCEVFVCDKAVERATQQQKRRIYWVCQTSFTCNVRSSIDPTKGDVAVLAVSIAARQDRSESWRF